MWLKQGKFWEERGNIKFINWMSEDVRVYFLSEARQVDGGGESRR